MFIPFLYELRRRAIPVGPEEGIVLAKALEMELHESSLDGFYQVARSLLVHNEAHLDAFDEAFLAHFRGIEQSALPIKKELLEWLENGAELSDESFDPILLNILKEDLQELFEQRAREQEESHQGGNYWIGSRGASPFGHTGNSRQAIRVAGQTGARSAIKQADARLYKPYRTDLTLDIRQMSVALRKLRSFVREGALQELDLDRTIDATAKNAGELEIFLRPERRPSTRIILMMDVGGSMEPYAHTVERLFSAASKATHFKELRSYYFHNCVHAHIYKTADFSEPIQVRTLLSECGKHYKLIMVGDGLMAPYELEGPGFSSTHRSINGLTWLRMLADAFDRSVWLTPEPPGFWPGTTIETIQAVFAMFPLTLDGLTGAINHLTRGRSRSLR